MGTEAMMNIQEHCDDIPKMGLEARTKGDTTMACTFLFLASLFEIMFALGLKYTQDFSRLVLNVVTLFAATAIAGQ
jgi:hypothetical protein